MRGLVLANLGPKALLGGAQPRPARAAIRELGRQLIAPPGTEALIVGRVRGGGLIEDLPGDLFVGAVRRDRRIGGDLRAINRDQPHLDQPRPCHSPSSCVNTSPSARSWRTRKRAIVA
jgi:hypothetical protein